MAEIARRCRRWPWLIIPAILLGGLIAWRCRPLNAEERRLVGIWRRVSGPELIDELTLSADRSFIPWISLVPSLEPKGKWFASEGRLWLRSQHSRMPLRRQIAAYFGFGGLEWVFELDSDHQMRTHWLNVSTIDPGTESKWERVREGDR